MDSEQWKQLDKLLHAALQRPPEERDAWLADYRRGGPAGRKPAEATT